jgi:hypothetical protein
VTATSPLSELASPELNSSEQLLSKYQAALGDDVSVADSVHTTSSNRHEASRRVTNKGFSSIVYNDLISVGSAAVERRMPRASTLGKQVDSAWLASRQQDGPPAEHLSVLLPSEPRVAIGVRVKGEGTATSQSHSQRGGAVAATQTTCAGFGLQASVDPDSLGLQFELDIDPTDLFGPLSTGLGPITGSSSGSSAGAGAGAGGGMCGSNNDLEPSWQKLEAIDYMLGRSLLLNASI